MHNIFIHPGAKLTEGEEMVAGEQVGSEVVAWEEGGMAAVGQVDMDRSGSIFR